jgi:hypothetical protein
MLQFIREQHSEVREAIVTTGQLDDTTEQKLKSALEQFKTQLARKQ